MNKLYKTSFALCLATTLSLSAFCSSDGKPNAILMCRTHPIYYPDEEIVFQLPHGVKVWRVIDMDGVERGHGEVERSTVAFRGGQIGDRFGAFRFETFDGDGKPVDAIWFARLTSRKVEPCAWVGTGTHAHHGWMSKDFRVVDLLAAAGIGIVRDEPLWDRTEKTKGAYVLPVGFESYVDRLLAHGIKMNMVLNYGNAIYDDPLDVSAFSRYCAWVADYFKGRVDRFEIWNEPQNFQVGPRYRVPNDNGMVWIKRFIELTQAADDAIRTVRSDATVAVTAEDVEYFLDMMLTNGIARAHNAISFHPYCHVQHRPEREFFLKDFGAKHKAYARDYGGATKWCATEAGWSTFTGKGKFWEVAGCYPRSSYAGQAECIVRMYLSAKAAGCDFACQYDFMNDGSKPDEAEHNFGMVHADGTPKPSFAAVAYLTRLLGAATFRKDISKEPTKYRVAGFVRDGKPILAAWCIEGDCEWEVPEAFGPLVDCRDLCGNSLPVPVVEGRTIHLTERPVYLLGK